MPHGLTDEGFTDLVTGVEDAEGADVEGYDENDAGFDKSVADKKDGIIF
ncbi:hypothetical protein UFOVP903_30 [uncultured Caudovirales phage]|uniref:Uncharacterized protein n=1 Tax=uncultured Caudovirales phage TaxID=2100421 RepID=A0A6J5RT26_9CAUD|nr:hypothetical protein UFOVP903_30 [uncultured Caudovirales phage]CAB4197437.1 hypothetical protein UFOVP1318_16 [uncultured Caudovirales phage]CAB4210592.1 hypothetical protein UFOVP1430_28 [uncultured Caudovirales phage]